MLMKPRPRSSHFTTPTCTPSNPALAIKTEPAPRVGTAGCTPSLYPTKPKATSHTHLPFHSVSQVSALPPPPAGNGYKSPLRKKYSIYVFCRISKLECWWRTSGLFMDTGAAAHSNQTPAPGWVLWAVAPFFTCLHVTHRWTRSEADDIHSSGMTCFTTGCSWHPLTGGNARRFVDYIMETPFLGWGSDMRCINLTLPFTIFEGG